MLKDNIKNLISNKLEIYHIEIYDLTHKHKTHRGYDFGGHFKLLIVSKDFNDLPLLSRHKLIYDVLNSMIKKEIHALSLKTLTVDEYIKQKPDNKNLASF